MTNHEIDETAANSLGNCPGESVPDRAWSVPQTESLSEDQALRHLGKIYTPAPLADWVAQVMVGHLSDVRCPVVLDPACGEGALLSAVSVAIGGDATLIGVDVDVNAVSNATDIFGQRATIILADALRANPGRSFKAAWRHLLNRQPVDAIIANPPWGAEVLYSRDELERAGFTLATGQFDSFELFLELAVSIIRPGGILAFIIPDSIFLPEHRRLRRLLSYNTTINLIARLGEGFFPGVYRGTTVLVCSNLRPRENHQVACFRLPKFWRDSVLSGVTPLRVAQTRLTHLVPQSRFKNDPAIRFDIDVRQHEFENIKLIRSFGANGAKWTDGLISGRGVELSKSGAVVHCPSCDVVRPRPRLPRTIICKACGSQFVPSNAKSSQIVRKCKKYPNGWKPLIVGEDVGRYTVTHSRIIRMGMAGINYKNPKSFVRPKLLIRKTGIGLKAAIDETGALTNQVVFYYTINSAGPPPPFYLDYLLGVLCSRVLLAYHLKTLGENEWRSHPYITQHVIADLPIPAITENSPQWQQARAIAAKVVERRTRTHDCDEVDISIEGLVAGLYGLSEKSCAWVLEVLESAQALEPIRTMRLTDPRSLRPIQA